VLCRLPVNAYEEQNIRFSTSPDHEWWRQQEESGADIYVYLTLPLEEKIIALYEEWEKDPDARQFLSVFNQQQEEERVLWKTDTLIDSQGSNVLMASEFNANTIPDLLLSYWTGGWSSEERWTFREQYLHLFLDWQHITDDPVPLSAIDFSISESEDGTVLYHADQDQEKPASQRYSLVLLLPASQETPLQLYLWSRIERFKAPERERTVLYQVAEYQAEESHFVRQRTLEEQRHVRELPLYTSGFLRSVIHTAQEQGREPLLLDFDAPWNAFLCSEETWFGLMEEWGRRRLD
jgi:hypothetical protein